MFIDAATRINYFSVSMVSLWPDDTQLLLLKAALGEGEDALAAFSCWRSRIDFADDLDPASFRMLPQLHHNLRRLGCRDPLMSRFAGVFRYAWVQVQQLHDDSARLLDGLARADIPVMMNKGLALGICHYDNPAHRPMSDVDVMVPREQVAEAAAVLQAMGWRVSHAGRHHVSWRDILDYRHSVGFVDEAGHEVDLHWAPSSELRGPRIERAFWDGARPMGIRGRTALRPSATCMLLHTALHGVRFNAMPPLRWIVDFEMILRKEGTLVDWEALADLAEASRTASRLSTALAYLRDTFGTCVPVETIARLAGNKPRLSERLENMSALIDPSRSPLHRLLADRRLAGVTRLVIDAKTARLPGIAARWTLREVRNLLNERHVRLG